MRLPERSWKNPLAKILKLIKASLSEKEQKEFEAGYRRFQGKLLHLGLIWERLIVDFEAHEKRLEVAFARAWEVSKTGKSSYTPTPKEESEIQHYREKSKFIELDLEDFFIHARILMDRIAWLTRFFIKGVEYVSFSKLRNFFLKPENIPFSKDEEYAKFIREKTAWYETMLKSYRDKLIVHDITSDMFGGIYSDSEITTLVRVRMRPLSQNKWNKHWQSILKLRDKYIDRISGLADIPLNMFELIRYLDSYSDLIDSPDLKKLEEIRSVFGTKLPDINSIADHIMDILNFYANHFY